MKNLRYLWLAFLFLPLFSSTAQTESPIIFVNYYLEGLEFWQALADEYNATQPPIPIEVQNYPRYLQQHDAILSSLLTGTPPDIAFVRNYDAALYQLSGSLVDLNSFLANSSLQESDFYPHFWQQDIFEGERLGLPLTRSAEALYVNLDLVQDLPTNRAEWEVLACEYPVGLRLDASYWLGMSRAENWIHEPEALLEILKWGNNLHGKGCLPMISDQFGAIERFAGEQDAFYLDSTSAQSEIENWKGLFVAEPFEQVMLPLPSEAGYVANWYGASLSIFKSNPEREAAAWAWVEWLAQPEQVSRWADLHRAFPARQDVPYSQEWQVFAEAIPYTEPNMLGYDLMRDELSFGIADMINYGQAVEFSLQSILETAQQIEQAFERQEP